jgi:hypothetical protein
MKKIIVISLLSMLSCNKPDEKKCTCWGPGGGEVEMGYCNGTLPPRNNMEITYGFTKSCY